MITYRFLPILLTLLIFAITKRASAAAPFELAPSMNGQPLGLAMETLEDATQALTLSDILTIDASGGLQTSVEAVPNYATNPAAQWVKFTLSNPLDRPLAVIIENKFTLIDHFALYDRGPDNAWRLKEGGDQIPFATRDIPTRQVAFRLSVEPGDHTFYARSQTIGTHQLPIHIWTPDEFFEHNAKEYGIIGILMGIHMVICLYNLFLFYSLKDRTYLVYVAYVCCNLIYQSIGLGLVQQIFSNLGLSETIPNKLLIMAVDFVIITSLLFSFMFLNIRKRLPSFVKVFMVIGIFSLFNLIVANGVSLQAATNICLINASLCTTVLILSGFLIARKGYLPASFYLVAWSCYLVGVTGTLMNFLGLFPTNAFTRWGQFTGGAFEIAILSLALGARINEKRRKHVDTIKELNLALEAKVEELINETESRKAMAAKAAHHLNNPIQAIAGLSWANVQEARSIRDRLEPMFPSESEQTADVKAEIDAFTRSFQAIEDHTSMTVNAIKRATTISNELKIMSGIDGIPLQKTTLGEFWAAFAVDIKDDDVLGPRAIILESMTTRESNHETWLEMATFTRSLLYVLKEGLEGLPPEMHVRLSAHWDEGLFRITAVAPAGLKAVPAGQWRELRFCQLLFDRFGATVTVHASSQRLVIAMRLPVDAREAERAATEGAGSKPWPQSA